MTFRGWPADALEFFVGLEADNSKTYWQANREVYETEVRAPMEELLAELAPAWGEGTIFRPYRDIRFSADKTPYKTHIAATVGDHVYVHLSADALGAGTGIWQMAPDQLERYRQAVDDKTTGAKLQRIVDKVRAAKVEVYGHGVLKTTPKGYPKEHPRTELLRYKGITSWQEWPAGAWLGTRRAKDRIVKLYELSTPMNDWLSDNIGPSTMTGSDRSR